MKANTDTQALDRIAAVLSGTEWDADTCQAIEAIEANEYEFTEEGEPA